MRNIYNAQQLNRISQKSTMSARDGEILRVFLVRVKFWGASDMNELSEKDRFKIAQFAKSWVRSRTVGNALHFLGHSYERSNYALVMLIGPYRSEHAAEAIAENVHGAQFFVDFVEAELIETPVNCAVSVLTEDPSLFRLSDFRDM